MSRIAPLLLFAASLGACAVGPDYERPEVAAPDDYRDAIDTGASFANTQWWELFQDEELNRLITIALQGNKDLAVAAARVDEARARAGIARADYYPRVQGSVEAGRGNTGEQFIPGIGVQNNYSLDATVFWEIDLFGKLRRSNEAARADLLASEENRRAVIISLVAEVANSYFLLRDLDARLQIASDTLAARHAATEIIRQRFEKGITPVIDVNQAEIQEADAAADLASFKRQVVQAENLISILVGRNPGAINRGDSLIDQIAPPAVPAGLPSDLLERRPDVLAAEQQLAAQTARIGVAQALRYPSLSLTGFGGQISTDISNVLDSESSIWDIGANLVMPLFTAGANKARVEVEQARTDQLIAQYELSVLQAFREVEDALIAVSTYRDEAAAREMQTRAARNAAMLSRARYDGGVTSYLEVLDSERSLFAAEIAVSATRRAMLSSMVGLYKALGGGWSPADPTNASTE